MRVPLEDEDLGVMEEAIEGGPGEERVVEKRRPLLERAVRGDDEGAALVALADDLVEVHRLLALEGTEAEIVDDQQVRAREAGETAVEGGVRPRRAELGEELVRRGVEDAVAGDAGAVAERLGEVALPDAGLTDEADVLPARDEGAGGELQDLGLRDRRVEGEVEVLDGLRVLEARAAEAHVELLRLAAFHLVGEEPVEEFARRERVVGGLADAEIEGLEDTREAELLEDGDELVSG